MNNVVYMFTEWPDVEESWRLSVGEFDIHSWWPRGAGRLVNIINGDMVELKYRVGPLNPHVDGGKWETLGKFEKVLLRHPQSLYISYDLETNPREYNYATGGATY